MSESSDWWGEPLSEKDRQGCWFVVFLVTLLLVCLLVLVGPGA